MRFSVPLILIIGHHQGGRLQVRQILEHAGFQAIEIDAGVTRKTGSGAPQGEFDPDFSATTAKKTDQSVPSGLPQGIGLVVSVDFTESEVREILNLPAPGDLAESIPIFYLSCTEAGSVSIPERELLANVRAMLRLRQAAAESRERLLQEDHTREEFLAMLAHELRNPLAPIMNAAHVLRLHAPANDTMLWAITMVERQTRHLTHLVDDLLDVSRITRGKIELHRELITLRALLQNAAEANRPVIADRGHQFVVDVPEEPLWLDADPTRLEQILNNLLHNASKYTPRGGRVALSADREVPGADFPHGAVAIRVRDSGIGIGPDLLHRVFDVFSQADRTLDRAEGGLGLGLTLVRRLTEMHGGKVEAHSEGLGRGSEFVVHLPLVPLAPETFEARPREEHTDELEGLLEGGQSMSRRVLVVDDQVDTAQSLAELLEIWGHQVRIGYDGPSGVELAEQFQPEVVLLDIGLPLMNGYEVARRLRERHGHDVMLVAMTGYGQDEDRRRALEAGFDLHMTKPVDLGALRELILSASTI